MADDSRNSGNKLPGTGRNTTLYIVLAGIGILGFFYWSVQSSILKIAPRQFEQLVKKSSRIADGGELATESDGITHETAPGVVGRHVDGAGRTHGPNSIIRDIPVAAQHVDIIPQRLEIVGGVVSADTSLVM